jgi:hypothetical protein
MHPPLPLLVLQSAPHPLRQLSMHSAVPSSESRCSGVLLLLCSARCCRCRRCDGAAVSVVVGKGRNDVVVHMQLLVYLLEGVL